MLLVQLPWDTEQEGERELKWYTRDDRRDKNELFLNLMNLWLKCILLIIFKVLKKLSIKLQSSAKAILIN